MALAGVELETLVSDTDALTTRPPPCGGLHFYIVAHTHDIRDIDVDICLKKKINYKVTKKETSEIGKL